VGLAQRRPLQWLIALTRTSRQRNLALVILQCLGTAGKGKVEMTIPRIEEDENTSLPGLVSRRADLKAGPWPGGHAHLGHSARQRAAQSLPDGCQTWLIDRALRHFYPLLC
jgi:hypothetical protein